MMTGDSFTKNPIERRKYFWIYAEKKGRNVSVLPREYGQRYFEFLHEHGKFNGRWYGPEGTTRRRLPKIIEAPERGSLPSNARFFLLDPADEPIYRAAAPFGLAADWRKATAARGYWRQAKKANDYGRFDTGLDFDFTIPGTLNFAAGVEAKICEIIQDRVAEGVLEVFASAHSHSSLARDIYRDFNSDLIVGSDKTAQRTKFLALINERLAEADEEAKAAATGWVRTKAAINADFEQAGSNFAKTMTACAKYIDGEFGVDWFIKDYWNTPQTANFHSVVAGPHSAAAELESRRIRHGYPVNHFLASQLSRALILANPELQTVYREDF